LEAAGSPEIHVRDYGLALWKRKWLVLITLMSVLMPVVVYVKWIQEPTYESTAALVVKVLGKQAQLFPGARPATKLDVDTEIEIMKSPPVLARPAAMLEAVGLDPLRWLKRIDWIRIEETSVVHIRAESPSPELARDIANAVGDSYIEYSRRTTLDTSRSAFVWLERQLADAKARMQSDEEKLRDFRKTSVSAAIRAGSDFDNDYHRALMSRHAEAKLAGAAAGTQLDEYGQLLDQCGIPKPGPPGNEPTTVVFDEKADHEKLALLAALSNSDRLAEITAQIDAATAALNEKLKTLKPRHPQIITLKEQAAMLDRHYKAAFLTECQKGYVVRRARLTGLQAMLKDKEHELDEYRQQFFRTANQQLEFAVLQRNVEASRMLYGTVLSKLKEFDLSQGATRESARFIQRAPLGFLKNPENGIKIAFAMLCGVLLGVGVALLMEYFDTTLKNADDVERTLGLTVLATLPSLSGAAATSTRENPDLFVVLD
jgi:succinoglycan biosynthesis transport protein ExoP